MGVSRESASAIASRGSFARTNPRGKEDRKGDRREDRTDSRLECTKSTKVDARALEQRTASTVRGRGEICERNEERTPGRRRPVVLFGQPTTNKKPLDSFEAPLSTDRALLFYSSNEFCIRNKNGASVSGPRARTKLIFFATGGLYDRSSRTNARPELRFGTDFVSSSSIRFRPRNILDLPLRGELSISVDTFGHSVFPSTKHPL